MPQLFVLFENASGYGLFEVVEFDDMSSLSTQVAESVADMSTFGKIIKLKAFQVRVCTNSLSCIVDYR